VSAAVDIDDGERPASTFKAELVQLLPHLRAFCRFLCQGDVQSADDLAQETLMRAWASHETYKPSGAMRAWLFVIARNLYYSAKRRQRFVGAYDPEHAERTLSVDSVQNGVLELDDTRRALAELPTDQRDALILVTAGGLSYEEAAQVCGCATGTIKSRVNRARTALLSVLDRRTGLARADAPADRALDSLVADAQRLADGT
jgi:RNA polymerase sigma-70 factor, ECF subfamily